MNKKEAIESIKNATKAISLLFSNKEAEVKLEAVKLKQGDMMVDVQGELAERTKVVTSSSTGSQDAADAHYELSNGQEFTTKGGKIDKVINDGNADDSADNAEENLAVKDSPVEEATEAPAEEATEVNDAQADAANTAAIQTLVQKITEMDTMISAIKEALAGKASTQAMSALGEQFTAIQSAFEVLADSPAEFSKVDKSVEAKDNKAKKLELLAGLMNKN